MMVYMALEDDEWLIYFDKIVDFLNELDVDWEARDLKTGEGFRR